jgi:hypothetical protein
MAAASNVNPRPIAGSIGLLFGGLWSYLAATGLPVGLQLPFDGLGALITLALIAALWTERNPVGSGGRLFRRWGYLIAVVLEVVAIYAASVLFARYGLTSYLVQAVGVIVGLHFIGLWQATRQSRFLWIAGGICGVSALAALLPSTLNGFNPRIVATGLGNALVLWICAGRSWRRNRSGARL